MSAMIRFRKATDRKFLSIRADLVKSVEDTTATLKEGESPVDVVILITEIGNIPVEESSNKVLLTLEAAGVSIIK